MAVDSSRSGADYLRDGGVIDLVESLVAALLATKPADPIAGALGFLDATVIRRVAAAAQTPAADEPCTLALECLTVPVAAASSSTAWLSASALAAPEGGSPVFAVSLEPPEEGAPVLVFATSRFATSAACGAARLAPPGVAAREAAEAASSHPGAAYVARAYSAAVIRGGVVGAVGPALMALADSAEARRAVVEIVVAAPPAARGAALSTSAQALRRAMSALPAVVRCLSGRVILPNPERAAGAWAEGGVVVFLEVEGHGAAMREVAAHPALAAFCEVATLVSTVPPHVSILDVVAAATL